MLITCKTCGQTVSDNAAKCPHCGTPIAKTLYCRECGAGMKATDEVCPNCGCPANHRNGNGYNNCEGVNSRQSNRYDRVQNYLMVNRDKFMPHLLDDLRRQLNSLNDSEMNRLECVTLKDPILMLIISVFLGALGIDRFMLGDTKNCLLKLLLTLLCGIGVIWWVVDLFLIMDKTKMYNYEQVQQILRMR